MNMMERVYAKARSDVRRIVLPEGDEPRTIQAAVRLKAEDLLEEGIRRYCKHSQLQYEGMLCAHHLGYQTTFMDEEKQRLATAFAEKLLGIND